MISTRKNNSQENINCWHHSTKENKIPRIKIHSFEFPSVWINHKTSIIVLNPDEREENCRDKDKKIKQTIHLQVYNDEFLVFLHPNNLILMLFYRNHQQPGSKVTSNSQKHTQITSLLYAMVH
jgi:hypothetical protein